MNVSHALTYPLSSVREGIPSLPSFYSYANSITVYEEYAALSFRSLTIACRSVCFVAFRLFLLLVVLLLSIWGFNQRALAVNDFNDGSRYVNGIMITAPADDSSSTMTRTFVGETFANNTESAYILLGKWMPRTLSRPVATGDTLKVSWQTVPIENQSLIHQVNFTSYKGTYSLLEVTSRWLS